MTLVADAFESRPAETVWRGALPASLLVHGALLIGALWLMQPGSIEEPDELAAIGVSIIEMQTASDAAVLTRSDATAEMVAAGAASPQTAETASTVTAEQLTIVEPIEATAAPVDPPPLLPLTASVPLPSEPVEIAQPVERPMPMMSAPGPDAAAPEVEPLTGSAAPAPIQLAQAASAPVASNREVPSVEPVKLEAPIAETAPAEAIRPVEDATPEPAAPKPRTIAKQQTTKSAKPKAEPKKPPASAGNGGRSNADASASAAKASGGKTAAEGGSAAVTRYPGQVQAALRRALQSQSGSRRGEVQVKFVIAGNGSVSGVRIVKSSGNDALDAAALATVRRAAPFPPIPADADRTSWSFVLPLRFR